MKTPHEETLGRGRGHQHGRRRRRRGDRARRPGGAALNPWTVTWTVPSGVTLSNGWNATVTQSGTTFTAQAPSWAAPLAPGASATIGFTANGPSSPAPAGVELNGAACAQ